MLAPGFLDLHECPQFSPLAPAHGHRQEIIHPAVLSDRLLS